MGETTIVPCRACEGTGHIELARCAEIVHGRRCKNPVRNDPHYFWEFPDREYVKPYCGMHGNARLRYRLETPSQPGEES